MLLIIAAAIIVLGVGVYWFTSDRGERIPPPPATSKEAVPEIAREVISEQQEQEAPDYDDSLDRARALRAEGKLADAQLLYFFAAKGGNAEAALELAEMYDPVRFDATQSLMDQPDAFQAFKWYQQALEGGQSVAAERLEALQIWATEAADSGDLDAEQLLMQWE